MVVKIFSDLQMQTIVNTEEKDLEQVCEETIKILGFSQD